MATRTIDVGLLAPDEQAHVSFELTNQSSHPLEIENVISECGCTAVKLSQHSVPPLGRLSLPVTIDARSAGWNRFHKKLQVRFLVGNERTPHDLVLSVKGEIDQSRCFHALPGVVHFGTVTAGETARAHVVFFGSRSLLDALPEQIVITGDEQRQINIRYDHLTPESGTRRVEFLLVSGESSGAGVNSEVTIDVDGPEPHRLLLPVKARVAANVDVQPRRILLTDSNPAENATARLTLSARDGSALAVDEISTDLPLEWSVLPSAARDVLSLHLAWTAAGGAAAPAAGLLRIALKDRSASVVVPVVRVTQRDVGK